MMEFPVPDRFPRLPLAHLPTPLERLDRLSEHLGGPTILVKRDDLTGLGLGGNKIRKLEYLVAEARTSGADTLVTVGGVQSNHCRQTAATAARLGMACELILVRVVPREDPDYEEGGNVLLDGLLGATVHVVDDAGRVPDRLGEISERVSRRGGRVAFFPPGGSTPTGALGFVRAAAELLEQTSGLRIDRIVLGASTGGTAAGILSGLTALGASTRLSAACVYDSAEVTRRAIEALAVPTAELLGMAPPDPQRLEVYDGCLGEGYGLPTRETIEALRSVARLEGLLLDPVYTGKAMAGLIDLVRSGGIGRNETVVFWHTGGTPALFVYPECRPGSSVRNDSRSASRSYKLPKVAEGDR